MTPSALECVGLGEQDSGLQVRYDRRMDDRRCRRKALTTFFLFELMLEYEDGWLVMMMVVVIIIIKNNIDNIQYYD